MGKILYTFLGTFTLALLMGTSYNMADYENYCGFYASSINFDFFMSFIISYCFFNSIRKYKNTSN